MTMVPPGLSLSLSVGIEYAQSRLKKCGIVALKGRLINAAGRMKVMFFDKTGTLTINEMKLDSIYLSVETNGQAGAPRELLDYDEEYLAELKDKRREPSKADEIMIMKHFATNHALSYVNGEILGDPMEEELFKFSKSDMLDEDSESEDAGNDNMSTDFDYLKKIKFVKPTDRLAGDNKKEPVNPEFDILYVTSILDFKSNLQRMSVIVKDPLAKKHYVFTKGAPEKVIALCRPDSLPTELQNIMKTLAKHGYRILAFGMKEISEETILVDTCNFRTSRETSTRAA